VAPARPCVAANERENLPTQSGRLCGEATGRSHAGASTTWRGRHIPNNTLSATITTDRREVFWNLVLQYSSLGFMLVQGVVLVPVFLPRIGSAEFGVWLVASGVASWVAIIDPGITSLMQQRVSRALGAHVAGRAERLARRGLLLNAALTTIMLVAGAVTAGWLARVIDPGAKVAARTGWWLVFLSVAGVALALLANALTSLGVSLRAARVHTMVTLASAVLGLGVTLGGLALGWGVLALPIGLAARVAVQSVVAYALVWPKLRETGPEPDVEAAETDSGYSAGLLGWSALEKLAGTLAMTADVFLIGRIFDSVTVTSYVLTRRPVDVLAVLLLRSSGALIPTLSYLAGKRADTELSALVVSSGARIAWLLGLAALGTVVFLGPIVALWVGPQHYLGDGIGAMLAATLMVQVFAGAFLNFMWAGVAPQDFLRLSTALNVLIVFGVLVGVAWGGVSGLLLGSLIPRVMIGLWLAPRLALAALRIAPAARAELWRETANALVALGAGLATFIGLQRFWPGPVLNGLAALLAGGISLVALSGRLRGDLGRLRAAVRTAGS
jgi:O-antigen/teichoic acid export membrane protein